MSCCRGHASRYWCERHPDVYKDKYKNYYCVFHAPSEHKDIPPELFNDLFFQEIAHAVENEEPCNLSLAIIPGDIDFAIFNDESPLPQIDFKEAVFEGAVDFSNVTFGGKIDLTRTEFLKEVSFLNADFKDEALFFDSIFNMKVNFKDVKFEKIVCISWGSFKAGADMGGTQYGGKLLLKRPSHN
ncbi:MAG: pentapeptide repeat-containing protein [Thermodesulfobacteriota bacterium]